MLFRSPDIPNSGTSDTQAEAPAPTAPKLEQYLQSMTLEEKVAQLFIILPESLIDGIDCVTAAGDMTQKAFDEIPVGGFIYLRENLQSEEQVKAMLSGIQTFSRNRLNLPAFLCVDEEGGPVARIGGSGRFDVPIIPNMAKIGETKDFDEAHDVGVRIGDRKSTRLNSSHIH